MREHTQKCVADQAWREIPRGFTSRSIDHARQLLLSASTAQLCGSKKPGAYATSRFPEASVDLAGASVYRSGSSGSRSCPSAELVNVRVP
jgi:hypothetical protein